MRIRKGQGYDFRRTLRQRAVLYKLVDKLKTSDLGTLYTALDALMPNLYTNISKEDIIQLGLAVRGYSIEDTKGFPFDQKEYKYLGVWYGFPTTLKENAVQVHKYLFDTENYQVSDELGRINQKIINVIGY